MDAGAPPEGLVEGRAEEATSDVGPSVELSIVSDMGASGVNGGSTGGEGEMADKD